MKFAGIIIKSMKEQIRSYWILCLSLIMGPFFILVYYLIVESSKLHYDVLVINQDKGFVNDDIHINLGKNLLTFFKDNNDTLYSAFNVIPVTDKEAAILKLKNKGADALIIIPAVFSENFSMVMENDSVPSSTIEFIGDLTSTNYLISAVWANELLNEFVFKMRNTSRYITVKETALGTSATADDFDMIVPGILIISIIMLMFTASIAFVSEIENKTILRLKLSRLSPLEFLGGIGFVQLIVGILSVILTLLTAILLGFNYEGSLIIMFIIASLTSLSIIAFSLIIAALTKSSNEVLIAGNFPMFLFMFFTGAAFPLKTEAVFTISGYPVTIPGLMTPVHAISALNKTLVMDMDFVSIIPEIISIIILTFLYFAIGAVIFKRRHLKLV